MNLTEATMLALQGKLLEESKEVKKESINVSLQDDGSTIVDTPEATIAVQENQPSTDIVPEAEAEPEVCVDCEEDNLPSVDDMIDSEPTIDTSEAESEENDEEDEELDESKSLTEKASITVTRDVSDKEQALEIVNGASQFKVGQEVEVKDWNGNVYKVKKTESNKLDNDSENKEVKTEDYDDESDTYESGIFKEIEDALRDAGLEPVRFIDDGVLTNNIGWTVRGQQLSCDGSYIDSDYKSRYLGENKSEPSCKFSKQTFTEALNNFYKSQDELVESVEVSKVLRNRKTNDIKLEAKVKNTDGTSKDICLEMNVINSGKTCTKYSLKEDKELKTEGKEASKSVVMLTKLNENKILECKYIKN